MFWKPNRWIAASLGLVAQWASMLYLMRPLLAVGYVLLNLAAAAIAIAVGRAAGAGATLALVSVLVVPLVCAVHAFWLAGRQPPVEARPWFSRWYGIVGVGMLLFVMVFLMRSLLFEPFRISSTAMYPTLPPGSLAIVRKWGFGNYGTYGLRLLQTASSVPLRRGDIIVFEYPRDPEQDYVKRVVGLPGDVVEFRDGALAVNGAPAAIELIGDEAGGRIYQESIDGRQYRIAQQPTRSFAPQDGRWVVPAECYFVVGDNRDNSADSRHWGFVPAANVIGRLQWQF